MSNSKYIVYNDRTSELDTMLIFPEWISHASIAKGHGASGPLVSAGFIDFDATCRDSVCYGRSESLNLSSRPEFDTKLLHQLMGLELFS